MMMALPCIQHKNGEESGRFENTIKNEKWINCLKSGQVNKSFIFLIVNLIVFHLLDDETSLSEEPDQNLGGNASGFEKYVIEKLDQILSKLEVMDNQKKCVCVERKSK